MTEAADLAYLATSYIADEVGRLRAGPPGGR